VVRVEAWFATAARVFQCAAVFQIRRNAGRPENVTATCVMMPARAGATALIHGS